LKNIIFSEKQNKKTKPTIENKKKVKESIKRRTTTTTTKTTTREKQNKKIKKTPNATYAKHNCRVIIILLSFRGFQEIVECISSRHLHKKGQKKKEKISTGKKKKKQQKNNKKKTKPPQKILKEY